ncbi:hypothetical protein [Actinophytocola sp.]|uniref:hypothetical protein n=1 Tax=Actinophytocola sp. TaxID=1872138 RepID=UPI002D7F24D2|nr:hypothetical protein [Actinophytocola sp.]HET9143183.1 hypothetical protein [Actinophytocola sp.]
MIRRGVRAGLIAGLVSGVPSTLHALATGDDPLAATVAAGSILLPRQTRRTRLIAAAVPVHFGLSAAWGVALAAVLPPRHAIRYGVLAGAAIAALDLGVAGRRLPMIRALPVVPQVLDHLVYGAVAAALLASD